MAANARFYLDHAATSWPKPPGSLEACIEYQKNNGAAAGRGVYRSAEVASELVRKTRRSVADLIGVTNSDQIAFCSNGTQSLNAAILGLLQSPAMRGCHVVTTETEHNSVLRPLVLAAQNSGIHWTAAACDDIGWVDPMRVKEAIKPNTRLIIINHVSNVTGAIQDVQAMADIAKEHNAILILDAAQSLGYLPINVESVGVSVLAAPGHKGAGGMLGTGILYVSSEVQSLMQPLWIGGTGTISDSIVGPFDWLPAIESGNCNLPAIASLQAGIHWLRTQPLESQLPLWTTRILEAIAGQKTLQLIGPGLHESRCSRLPVISLVSTKSSCHELAMLLDSACGVEARSGFHCAGLIHTRLQTAERGGTLRLSLGHTSTEQDILEAIAGIELCGSM